MDECGAVVVPAVVSPCTARQWRDRAVHGDAHAHGTLMWEIREHAAVHRTLASELGASDIVVGFDGVGVRRPGETGLELGWHVDQDGSHPVGRACVQAVLALSDVTPATGGTALLRGSHLDHAELCARLGAPRGRGSTDAWEFVPVPDGDPILTGGAVWQPTLTAGSALLWDSRTVHRVRPPTHADATERVVAYLSAAPEAHASDVTLLRRIGCYERGEATTHWPTRCVPRGGGLRPPTLPWGAASYSRRRLVAGRLAGTSPPALRPRGDSTPLRVRL
jgi:hypothetical protein